MSQYLLGVVLGEMPLIALFNIPLKMWGAVSGSLIYTAVAQPNAVQMVSLKHVPPANSKDAQYARMVFNPNTT